MAAIRPRAHVHTCVPGPSADARATTKHERAVDGAHTCCTRVAGVESDDDDEIDPFLSHVDDHHDYEQDSDSECASKLHPTLPVAVAVRLRH